MQLHINSPGIHPPDRTATVLFEGDSIEVRPGISIAAALTESGVVAYRHAAVGDRGQC